MVYNYVCKYSFMPRSRLLTIACLDMDSGLRFTEACWCEIVLGRMSVLSPCRLGGRCTQ